MRAPSYADAFQVLLLQLASDGRADALLGDGVAHAREVCPPYLVGKEIPDLYLEFPLLEDPFLDVTLLYGQLEPGTKVEAAGAADTAALFDWYRTVREEHSEVSFGFELDTSKPELPRPALHFQPRRHTELVEPFCELVGEPERARLYLDLAERMPEGWPLSFFGMFRGRPNAPLRVCGYLDPAEQVSCVQDQAHLAAVFDAIGFEAYDNAMLAEVREVMAITPGTIDFQFDVYPDGHLSDVFAIDASFDIVRPQLVRRSFERGPVYELMSLLERLGAADGRWRLAAGAAFARALPVELDDGSVGHYAFTLIPQWAKARWKSGKIQQAKWYYLGNAGLLNS